MEGGDLNAWPILEQAPQIYCIADQSREKMRRQCNQAMVEEYGAPIFQLGMQAVCKK